LSFIATLSHIPYRVLVIILPSFLALYFGHDTHLRHSSTTLPCTAPIHSPLPPLSPPPCGRPCSRCTSLATTTTTTTTTTS
jgi:hypothetical protein